MGYGRKIPTDYAFPINRRHQGLATRAGGSAGHRFLAGFQSIGVTKDWRQGHCLSAEDQAQRGFPINRRHQGLATLNPHHPTIPSKQWFPINRRNQGLATCLLPVVAAPSDEQVFPINRRHQGLATWPMGHKVKIGAWRFQSIGVTKDWRQN